MNSKLMTIKDLCDLIDIKPARGYELARLWEETNGAKGVPCIRIGERQLRFSRDSVMRHLSRLEGQTGTVEGDNING